MRARRRVTLGRLSFVHMASSERVRVFRFCVYFMLWSLVTFTFCIFVCFELSFSCFRPVGVGVDARWRARRAGRARCTHIQRTHDCCVIYCPQQPPRSLQRLEADSLAQRLVRSLTVFFFFCIVCVVLSSFVLLLAVPAEFTMSFLLIYVV